MYIVKKVVPEYTEIVLGSSNRKNMTIKIKERHNFQTTASEIMSRHLKTTVRFPFVSQMLQIEVATSFPVIFRNFKCTLAPDGNGEATVRQNNTTVTTPTPLKEHVKCLMSYQIVSAILARKAREAERFTPSRAARDAAL